MSSASGNASRGTGRAAALTHAGQDEPLLLADTSWVEENEQIEARIFVGQPVPIEELLRQAREEEAAAEDGSSGATPEQPDGG